MGRVAEATWSPAVVIGSGIAGLSVAHELGRATVVTAGELGDGASRWAQGGLAAALGPDDTAGLHAADTLAVSGQLADAAIARAVAEAAPSRVGWLADLGARFDTRTAGTFHLGREAGHHRDRIVHADGDATGAEVMRALSSAVAVHPDVEVLEHTRAVDLVHADDRVVGALVVGPEGARVLLADAVVLATGGIGQVYARTTNPPSATGDGLAMAARAGARLRDLEFVQFHPTALAQHRDPLPLVTEALRGAGATLVDTDGRRHLVEEHPDAELAPRDVVARANWRAQQRGPVYLDARAIGESLPERFPTVFASARAAGLDPRYELLPVTPAQHFHMGGVVTDEVGRTSLPGLYACGEVAATGLHGANRLASNSLVEGLVFGARVAATIAQSARDQAAPTAGGGSSWDGALEVAADALPLLGGDALPLLAGGDAGSDACEQLRRVMWDAGGLVRDEVGLRGALATLGTLRGGLAQGLRGRNLGLVAELVLTAALERRESRGGHWRRDHPAPAEGAVHQDVVPPPVARRRLAVTTVGRAVDRGPRVARTA